MLFGQETAIFFHIFSVFSREKISALKQLIFAFSIMFILDAAKDGNVKKLTKLLLKCDSPLDIFDSSKKSALQLAAKNGHVEIVRKLISAGAQVDWQDCRGWTPLHEAAAFNRYNCARLLMQGFANPNLRTIGEGNSPLHLASERGYNEVVLCLISSGKADCDLKLADGRSAAHKAARQGRFKTLQLLCQLGNADLSLRAYDGQTPLHFATLVDDKKGRCVAELLQVAGADPNVVDCNGFSPLHLAAISGREEAVRLLLLEACHASVGLRTNGADGLNAAELAAGFRQLGVLLQLLRHSHSRTMMLEIADGPNLFDRTQLQPEAFEILRRIRTHFSKDLNQCTSSSICYERQIDETALSCDLHSAMNTAGFTEARAEMQAKLSDALQDIVRLRWNDRCHIVGSYSDGWGNSLSRMDGVTDADADIDLTQILCPKKSQIHIDGACRCIGSATIKYINGHVEHTGQESSPAIEYAASPMRPAVDIIRALPCCQYPEIKVLNEGYHSHIASATIKLLIAITQDPKMPCHLVCAAPSGEESQQMRVSTSFLERRLMRSLTSVQGQVFVLLKYSLKRLLSERAHGIKTYHAKTLLFYMLESTPRDDWKPTCLVSKAKEGLQMLLDSLKESHSEHDQCMRHFFLRDAWLYLKKDNSGKKMIEEALLKLIDRFPQLMLKFIDTLRPLRGDRLFEFHPFVVNPETRLHQTLQESGEFFYHDLPDVVAEILLSLSRDRRGCENFQMNQLLETVRRIPDFARTARECLKILTHLKFGEQDAARSLLIRAIDHHPSDGVSATAISIKEHLESRDSAWKFCLWFSDRSPNLDFLPDRFKRTKRHFLTKLQLAQLRFINFSALIRCLCLDLDLANSSTASQWFEETLHSDKPDVQQLLMTLEFCADVSQLSRLIDKHREIVCDLRVARLKIVELLACNATLRSRRAHQALEALEAELTHC